MTHAEFAARCSNLASVAAAWSRDTLMIEGYLNEPIGENAAARFVREMRRLLDHIEARSQNAVTEPSHDDTPEQA